MIHPEQIGQALEAGAAGVMIAACVPENCQFREGGQWLLQRLVGARLPALKDVPAGRVKVGFYSPVETRRLERDLEAFARTLS
jgi:coenzyme F420-reducing hydrogenase delta subunit